MPIVRQTIFGDDAIKHRTYFGKIKVTDPNQVGGDIIILNGEDGEENGEESNNISTLTITVEYLDTYWTDWKSTDEKIGDIETCLDGIIAIQNQFIGGDD